MRELSPNRLGVYVKDDIPWIKILHQGKHQEFLGLLQQVADSGSLESRFRLINLRAPYGLYDKFDYEELTKQTLGAADRKKNNIYFTPYTSLANQGYEEILYFLSEFGYSSPQEKLERKDKLLNAKHTCSLLLKAVDLLTKSTTKKDSDKALGLMKVALSQPNVSYFYGDIAAPMVAFYLMKGDKKSLKQAYLWALVELTLGEPLSNPNNRKSIVGLLEFKRADGFKKLGLLDIDSAWNASSPNNHWDYQSLPSGLKELRRVDWPELIVKNNKINLKLEPIILFHHFDYDNQMVPFGKSAKNYLIDVYEDGRVNFTVGPRFDRTQNHETLDKLKPEDLKQLIAEFDSLGFENEPLNTMTKKECGMGGCPEFYSDYNHIEGFNSTYYITKRTLDSQRTVTYYLLEGVEDLPAFPAKVFALLENKLHTQHYRCGTVKLREYYKHCIDFDNKIFATANLK